jgi:hypothetical protein
VLNTRAGYGLLFEDAWNCSVSALTITGGERSPSQPAAVDGETVWRSPPDAAVVVKGASMVFIEDCVIRDNHGDEEAIMQGVDGAPAIVSGIMGINVRDGGSAVIRGNRIAGNSWDGIACYWDARAIIENNVIDGGENNGRGFGGGRGVGIGITLNPYAEVRGNLVRRYWKGIGFFVSPTAICEENVVEDMLTWGLSVWDAGHGAPRVLAERNLVHHTGACGASLAAASSEAAGAFRDNVIVRSGQNPSYDSGEPYCRQCALAIHGVNEGFLVEGNLSFDTREPGGAPGADDVSEAVFRTRLSELAAWQERWPALIGARIFDGP